MTKIIAYTALHYGKPYLASAIRSVIDEVDEYYVLYTPVGSHGHGSSALCPDTSYELHDIASAAAGAKLRWLSGHWAHEGQQRDEIFRLAPTADVIIPLDYDEIWQPGLLALALRTALANPTIKNWRIPFRHYWRSFYRCVVRDPAYPVRLIFTGGQMDATLGIERSAINHFGYAIPPALMRYKWQVHGHKNELRTDCDYFADIYEANRQTDCHPVGSQYWNPVTVNPFEAGWLPDWMREHPYAGLEVIE